MPAKKKPPPRDLFLVEHNPVGLAGTYLIQAVVAAPTLAAAKAAACALDGGDDDDDAGFGITVERRRLTVTRLGPLAAALNPVQVVLAHRDALVLAVSTGTDDPCLFDRGWMFTNDADDD